VVAHETGHAVLDMLQPGWLEMKSAETLALHESFGDLTAILCLLAQLDVCEIIIAETKTNLKASNFFADLAEEFGVNVGRKRALRSAINDFKLGQTSNEPHELSQVFTGAVYDILAEIFNKKKECCFF